MMKQIHPQLYDLLVLWYDQQRPMQALTALKLLTLWKDLWFSKKERQVEMDKMLIKFKSTVEELTAYHPLSVLDKMGLVILYDQIPRNIFRGTKRAWDYDHISRQLTKSIRTDKTLYTKLPVHFKITLCICMLHSQELQDQVENQDYIKEVEKLVDPILYKALYQLWYNHWDRVRLFGRIPQRNDALGRKSTAEQKQYLSVMKLYT